MPSLRNRRKSRKADEDIIKTEPDKKRATGEDDENDFDEDDGEVPLKMPEQHKYGWTSMRGVLDRKHVLRKFHSRQEETNFPFLSLPPEIRNMIYRYLLVSKAENHWVRRGTGQRQMEPIELETPVIGRLWRPGGIETAILSVNRQVRDPTQLD